MPFRKLVLLWCSTIVTAGMTLSQTTADFTAKYPMVTAFEIRPGMLMTARFSDAGQVCELTVEKRHYRTREDIDLSSNISPKLLDELTEELVPDAERGLATSKYLSPESYVTGGVSYIKRDFENVSIETHGSTSQACDGGDEILVIRWKKRACASRSPDKKSYGSNAR
jgi:hypothetical protein